MKDYPTDLKDLITDDYGNPLVCSGCSHSAGAAPFPGFPSGERPCFFCIRNVKREEWQEKFKTDHGEKLEVWYDGSKTVSYPMDCYHSCDMIEQIDIWQKKGMSEI